MAVFPALVLIAAGLGVLILVARETFQVHWRHGSRASWPMAGINERRFFRLGLSGYEPANPEYRIADDVRWANRAGGRFRHRPAHGGHHHHHLHRDSLEIGGALQVATGGGRVTIPAYMVLARSSMPCSSPSSSASSGAACRA